MSIMEYNGAAIIAMTGKDCVGIASDTRLGIQIQTLTTDFVKVFRMSDHLYVGLAGLASDVQTLHNVLTFRKNLYELREADARGGADDPHASMSPAVFSNLLSNILYEKRFGPYFIEPIVAGLDPKTGKPFLSAMDLIGAPVYTDDFVVAGTATANMYGMCETLYQPNMSPEQLFETLSQALLSSVDRDALSGWGAVVHIITRDGVTSRHLKVRGD